MGPHNHAHGLSQHQQSGVHKAYHHDGGGRGALDDGRYAYTGDNLLEGVGGHGCEEGTEPVARHFLKIATEQTEAEKEQGYGTQQG